MGHGVASQVMRTTFVLFTAVALGCGGDRRTDDPSVDGAFTEGLPTPDVPEIGFATGFAVSAGPGYRVVHASPDPSALEEGSARMWTDAVDRMVLVERGTRLRLPAELESAPRFEVPVRSVTVNRDADAVRVKRLGRLDRLRGIGGTGIYDSDLHRLVETGQLAAVGSALHRTTNTEFLLVEGIEAAFFRVASLDHAQQYERLRDVGVAAVPVFAWAERSYLGRAEWIRYIGLFLGAEEEADGLFSAMVARRDSLVALVSDAPRVPAIWAFRSGDRWMVHRNSLESELLADAGSENVFADVASGVTEGEGGFTEGVPMTDEEFLLAAGRARFWITWDRSDEEWPSKAYLDEIPAYREGRVYHHRVRVRPNQGGDDWYEGAQVDPTSVLADLIGLLHPDRVPDHRFEWIAPLERVR